MEKTIKIVVKTFFGLEEVLQEELKELGYETTEKLKRECVVSGCENMTKNYEYMKLFSTGKHSPPLGLSKEVAYHPLTNPSNFLELDSQRSKVKVSCAVLLRSFSWARKR